MDVPGYAETLFITDAAINIFPGPRHQARHHPERHRSVLPDRPRHEPRVAILSAVETVTSKIPSTIEAAALCKMADRGQITGGMVDGPLAFDNAIDPEAARIKGIKSPVAGRAQILVVPDLEAGNMLAKNLTLPGEGGQRRHRARRARADHPDLARGFVRARMASCAVAVLYADARRRARNRQRSVNAMDTILVVNAGSSSVKFQVFAVTGEAGLQRTIKGQMDGIGTRPRLRAVDGEAAVLVDRKYGVEAVPDRHQALAIAGAWLRDELRIAPRPSAIASCTAVPNSTARCVSIRRCCRSWSGTRTLAPLHQPNNLAPIRALLSNAPELPQVACFDTAFHRSHGDLADHYAIPFKLYHEGIRRYGFHGLSYEYIAAALPKVAPADRAQPGDCRASRQRCVDVRASSRPQRR